MSDAAGIARRLVEAARAEGRTALVEPGGFPLLQAYGIRCARHVFVPADARSETADLAALPGDRVVVKIASPTLLHRSDVGGVRTVSRDAEAVAGACRDMLARLGRDAIDGFTISEFVAHERDLGHELLVGLRFTDDFGPVVTVGAGGIYVEFLAKHFREADDVAVFPVEGISRAAIERRLEALPVVRLTTSRLRGQSGSLDLARLVDVVLAFAAMGRDLVPGVISECEVNPLAVTAGGLVALDVLVKVGREAGRGRAPRPLEKLASLLTPRRVGLIGVSESLNPGHIILNNLLTSGFPPDDIVIVKPGTERMEGVRCVPDLASVDGRLDLLVLAIGAAQVPAAVTQCVALEKAESIIVIPGGLDEKAGTGDMLAPMYEALAASRHTAWRGPVVNGGNCLGVRSLPGRYDTMFIPPHKMPPRTGPPSPVALVSQSGAFAITRAARLAALNPKYVVTVGNQMDLTVGDYLTWLADDREIEVFAVYVEGFRPLDGLAFLSAAREIVASGRHVILYRSGRTSAGAAATASHTASVAGDYTVTRELAASAGVVVADTLEDFDDLVLLFAALRGRVPAGVRLGAVSNAGFECVAMADRLGALALARFSAAGEARLAGLLKAARIDGLVDLHNPLDLTPMAGDAAYEDAVRAVLGDPQVDVGVVGCVPLTPALDSLAPGPAHGEDAARPTAVASRLARVFDEVRKPWVVVVDGGALYDPMAAQLAAAGVPTFRTADRALRLLNVYARACLAPRG
jgi:acyl-CoA synthetase (NDP forming)